LLLASVGDHAVRVAPAADAAADVDHAGVGVAGRDRVRVAGQRIRALAVGDAVGHTGQRDRAAARVEAHLHRAGGLAGVGAGRADERRPGRAGIALVTLRPLGTGFALRPLPAG